ncbi:hypothetical protein RFI_13179 [Reticulomyxa filosa]|uniref:Uncharacterized protein n=1 Tax=Reticulomyxa filosa TaxID=46433 RepID=X6NE15_RETFI|nr:hypothetical protein RFI_13179 [Reticulomyxa filosa]|eukprot:ETO23979.1 hypothetical protein RFI_13179 [Reticulomyxa filosa]
MFWNWLFSIAAFGPRQTGCNMLFVTCKDFFPHFSIKKQLQDIEKKYAGEQKLEKEKEEDDDDDDDDDDGQQQSSKQEALETFFNSIVQAVIHGFQLTTSQGPLCHESMYGVGFVIHQITALPWKDTSKPDPFGPISGQVLSVIQKAFVDAFLSQSPRLVHPMYKCFIQGSSEVLGSIYDVIGKRKGKITGDSIVEGTNLFDIRATLPVVASFGFANGIIFFLSILCKHIGVNDNNFFVCGLSELREQTEGNVVPQLTFSHWEVLDDDPLWIPMTTEEIEKYGESSNIEMYAKTLIDEVRKRKGMHIHKQIVAHAEKQFFRKKKFVYKQERVPSGQEMVSKQTEKKRDTFEKV